MPSLLRKFEFVILILFVVLGGAFWLWLKDDSVSPSKTTNQSNLYTQTWTSKSGDSNTLVNLKTENSWILVNVWATWCSPCRTEMPLLISWFDRPASYTPFLQKSFNGHQILLVPAAMDSLTNVEELLRTTKWPIQSLLIDGNGLSQIKAWTNNFPGVPINLLFNQKGTLIAYHGGDFKSKKEIETFIEKNLN
jgi:thiol-disulfide isomerase/thioredoxin